MSSADVARRTTTLPHASVVVPTYNRPDRLARCLEGLSALASARDAFEVVIVDDGGAIPLDEIVRPFSSRMDVRLIRQDNTGPAGARNAGARAARGRMLAFTDDDCVPDPGWLDHLLAAHAREPDALIGGTTVNALHENLLSEASQELVSYLYAYNDAAGGQPAFFTSNNMAVARELFLDEPFDTSFRLAAGEDRELCDRWLARGRTLRFAPDAVIHHYHRLSPAGYWKQHFNYGRGAFHFRVARARRGDSVRLEPLSFYTGLVVSPLRRRGPLHRRVLLSFWLGVSQAANAAGYFHERRRAARTSPD